MKKLLKKLRASLANHLQKVVDALKGEQEREIVIKDGSEHKPWMAFLFKGTNEEMVWLRNTDKELFSAQADLLFNMMKMNCISQTGGKKWRTLDRDQLYHWMWIWTNCEEAVEHAKSFILGALRDEKTDLEVHRAYLGLAQKICDDGGEEDARGMDPAKVSEDYFAKAVERGLAQIAVMRDAHMGSQDVDTLEGILLVAHKSIPRSPHSQVHMPDLYSDL